MKNFTFLRAIAVILLIKIMIVCSFTNLRSQFSPDYLIPSHTVIGGKGPYSMSYGLNDWSDNNLKNGKEINFNILTGKSKHLPEEPWLTTTTIGNNYPLLEIKYEGGDLKIILKEYPTFSLKEYYYPIPTSSTNVRVDIIGNPPTTGINIKVYNQDNNEEIIPYTSSQHTTETSIGSEDFAYNNHILTFKDYAENPDDFYSGDFIFIHPFEETDFSKRLRNLTVNIEKINIKISQPSALTNQSPGITILGCKNVNIWNSYFSSCMISGWGYLMDIRGCENVMIDNIEIEGFERTSTLNPDGKGGGGICINKIDENLHENLKYPTEIKPQWVVLQNCYFHGFKYGDGYNNIDALATNNPADGIVFNCYFEEWGGDAIDWGYRTNASNVISRIERCVFDKCYLVKASGGVEPAESNPIVFYTNNYHII